MKNCRSQRQSVHVNNRKFHNTGSKLNNQCYDLSYMNSFTTWNTKHVRFSRFRRLENDGLRVFGLDVKIDHFVFKISSGEGATNG